MSDALPLLRLTLGGPDSFGGVDAYICFENDSGETFKYITFTATPYNAVDDPVASDIGGVSTTDLVFTGPTLTGWIDRGYWERVWYGDSIKYVKIEKVTIEHMDGTTISFDFPTPQGTFTDHPGGCPVGEVEATTS